MDLKVRGAHRGSVTRIIAQVDDTLESTDLSRLRQYKMSLSEKLEVLSKLDDELIEMVDEEELDNEVEQADIIRERIGLCVMSIDKALEYAISLDPTHELPPVDTAVIATPDATPPIVVAVSTSTPVTFVVATALRTYYTCNWIGCHDHSSHFLASTRPNFLLRSLVEI